MRRNIIFVVAYLGIIALIAYGLSKWQRPASVDARVVIKGLKFTVRCDTVQSALNETKVSSLGVQEFAPVTMCLRPDELKAVEPPNATLQVASSASVKVVGGSLLPPSLMLDHFDKRKAMLEPIALEPGAEVTIVLTSDEDSVTRATISIVSPNAHAKVRIQDRFHAELKGCRAENLDGVPQNAPNLAFAARLQEGYERIAIGAQDRKLVLDVTGSWAKPNELMATGIPVSDVKLIVETSMDPAKSSIVKDGDVSFLQCPGKSAPFAVGEAVDFYELKNGVIEALSVDSDRSEVAAHITGEVHHIAVRPGDEHHLSELDIVRHDFVLRTTFASLGILPVLLGIWRWIKGQ